MKNLELAFPEWTIEQRLRMFNLVWHHFIRVAFELMRLPHLSIDDLKKYIDISDGSLAVLERALKQNRGVIFVSGHLGNWEWMGAFVAMLGFPLSYVVETQSNRLVDNWVNQIRMNYGAEIITRQNAVKGILTALKRQRIVAMLSDQDAGPAGVFVSFFGHPASTPKGPAVFHLKTDAPIIFGSAILNNNKYHISLEDLKFPPLTGDRDSEEKEIMKLITNRIEQEIRKHPEQYLWLHRRWKTKQ